MHAGGAIELMSARLDAEAVGLVGAVSNVAPASHSSGLYGMRKDIEAGVERARTAPSSEITKNLLSLFDVAARVAGEKPGSSEIEDHLGGGLFMLTRATFDRIPWSSIQSLLGWFDTLALSRAVLSLGLRLVVAREVFAYNLGRRLSYRGTPTL